MIKLFVNSNDRTDYLEDGSLSISDQLQNKANAAKFLLNPGVTEPTENQEVKIYDAVKLVSASGTTVIVTDDPTSGLSILPNSSIERDSAKYGLGRGKFRVGQTFWLDIGGSDEEKVTISAIEEHTTAGQVKITTTETIANSHSADEDAGRLVFAGNISSVRKKNPRQLSDVEYEIQCVDFTKIFDKKLINDSWADFDARQIINDFCNTTINLNNELDDMDYDDDSAVQAEWIESGDGNNPTNNTTDQVQGDGAVDLNWTNSGGTATFSATPTSQDLSALTGASSGSPVEGNVTLWYKRSAAAGISSVAVRVGSDSSNYVELSFTPEADTDMHFISLALVDGTVTGTPDWTAVDYLAIVVSETTSAALTVDDIRMTAEGSFTLYGVETSSEFDDARAGFKKPTVFIERLAKTLGYYWYIDYERDIHFFARETNVAPFNVGDDENNFIDLSVDVDISQLKNRQTVRGGVKTSDNKYGQVAEGNSAVREWILKSQFKNLEIYIDDNSSTDTTEAGTTTTNVTATAHGLVTGDWIVNRTRSNAVREITKVDDDNFTVEAVASQTSGDTFSKFDISKDSGVEGLVDETTVDYVENFNEKSVRATDSEATLDSGDFILFRYNEIVPIRVQATDPASIATMKALVGGDGVFDGAVITDQSLDSTQAARDRAEAEVNAYANAIVTIRFKTDFEGLESGQILSVTDSNKGINDDYIIQKVQAVFKTGDYAVYTVTAASSLFGLIEYFQKLSESIGDRLIDEDEIIDQIFSENVTMSLATVDTVNTPDESASETPTLTLTETSNTVTERDVTTDPYKWQPHASDGRWNLAQYG